MPEGVSTVDLTYGGPGRPPQPWQVHGSGISYDGALLLPFTVPGGNMGPGTINAMALYVQGVQFVNPVGLYLPITGGTLTGALALLNIASLQIPGGGAGQALVTDGNSNLSWSSSPPGGPYLPLAGGALTGALQITGPSNLVMGGGTPGQFLTTNGLGVLSWATVISGGSASVVIGDTPPVGPAAGNLWYDSVGGQLYIYYHDADSSQWVITVNQNNSAQIFVADNPPVSPNSGNLWWDSAGGQLYIRYNDGNSAQWVIANSLLGAYLPLAGGTLTGPLTLAADPAAALQPVTKQYVDNKSWGHNRLINGDMRIDQRNSGASGTASGYTVDRWVYSGSVASRFTWQRNTASTVSFTGFGYSLGLFNAASSYTPVAADSFQIYQKIEADLVVDFAWGTANAQAVTLSFWVFSNVAGTYGGVVTDNAGLQSYPFTYNIPTANTWTKCIVNVPGCTFGTWVLQGNAAGVLVHFDLGSGANWRGPPGVWAATNYVGATGTVQLSVTASSNWFITGVKLEIGNIATPFPHETLAKCMSDCQRYYQVISSPILGGYQPAAGNLWAPLTYLTQMRATPTIAISGTPGYSNSSALGFGALGLQACYASCAVTAAGNATCTYIALLSAEM